MGATDFRKKRIKEQIDRLNEQLTALDEFGVDDFPVGAVLTFDKRYGNKSPYTSYKFAAVKVNPGRWYITGKSSTAKTWDELVLLILEGEGDDIPEVWYATEWEQV
jgi:hypothetical protein